MQTSVPRHYPYVTRMVASLFAEGALTEVAAVEIEPEYGYVARLHYTNGTYRMTRGNNVGLNAGSSMEVVNDKAYTKFFLRRSGINCPDGEAFLLEWWATHLQPRLTSYGFGPMRTARDAPHYVDDKLGFPVYVKPADGSRGAGIWRATDTHDLVRVLEAFERERVKVAVVERAVDLPDYRLVVLDGMLISAYRRTRWGFAGTAEPPSQSS